MAQLGIRQRSVCAMECAAESARRKFVGFIRNTCEDKSPVEVPITAPSSENLVNSRETHEQ
jgi:hypothetical protein